MFTELTGEEQFDTECLATTDGKYYVGTKNRTLSGIPCQAWDTQTPHIHSYDNLNYFPADDSSIEDVGNYCRNLKLASYSARPWCLTSTPVVSKEYCDIPLCTGLNDFRRSRQKPNPRIIISENYFQIVWGTVFHCNSRASSESLKEFQQSQKNRNAINWN